MLTTVASMIVRVSQALSKTATTHTEEIQHGQRPLVLAVLPCRKGTTFARCLTYTGAIVAFVQFSFETNSLIEDFFEEVLSNIVDESCTMRVLLMITKRYAGLEIAYLPIFLTGMRRNPAICSFNRNGSF